MAQEVPTVPFSPGPTVHAEIRLKHVEDLQSALEEYVAFHDGTIVRKVRPQLPSAAGPRTVHDLAASR